MPSEAAATDAVVSVILPVYNGERFVQHAIESVLAQTHRRLQLVIVNDGSTDGSRAVIARYLSDPRIIYREQANQGVARARNAGIAAATGAYVALIDQDDLWLPEKLEHQVRYLEDHPEVGLLHARVRCIDAGGEVRSCDGVIWVYPFQGRCAPQLARGNGIAPLTVMLRRSCIDDVGTFDQLLAPADDWELWIRIARQYELGFSDEVTALYRWHGENVSGNRVTMHRAVLRVLRHVAEHYPDVAGRPLRDDFLQYRCQVLRDLARQLECLGLARSARRHWRELFASSGDIEALLACGHLASRQREAIERAIARFPWLQRRLTWYAYKGVRALRRSRAVI
jgi:glycosyltransferase involved in cell wall biosynthesis